MPCGDVDLNERLDAFIRDVKQGTIVGSFNVAYKTVGLMRRLIAQSKWHTAEDLMKLVKEEGKRLIEAEPSETAIGNMVRRVLKIVREEYVRAASGKTEEDDPKDSLQKLLMAEGETVDFNKFMLNLKATTIEAVNELILELETSADNIAAQALEHIHAKEVVLTGGDVSKTVEAFLKRAAKKRKFHVIVVECAPQYHGQELAVELAKASIETTVITDSAVFAMMSRVNKVIIETHTVMANGGLKAFNGSYAIALAAKHHSVPLVVCAAMYKLSPQYLCSSDQNAFNKFASPQDVLKYSTGEILSKVHIHNPVFDYVPPELVTLFISNIGGNAPSYIYRLLSELYHSDDYNLE
ncbi:hypothetical protein NP493_49g09056 [Ridgeia piscesae]|uniref:Translation initiation factor eIF2B subunit beta n=1 Tax=Ridgeia piscesae TaxID=27915 RepID=A0AAD9PB06_RIDPI|nr:hypothetical protein NP493_49g09056 [Ridgeia piscesae]